MQIIKFNVFTRKVKVGEVNIVDPTNLTLMGRWFKDLLVAYRKVIKGPFMPKFYVSKKQVKKYHYGFPTDG